MRINKYGDFSKVVHEATLITQHLCWLHILFRRSHFCNVLSSNFGRNKM